MGINKLIQIWRSRYKVQSARYKEYLVSDQNFQRRHFYIVLQKRLKNKAKFKPHKIYQ